MNLVLRHEGLDRAKSLTPRWFIFPHCAKSKRSQISDLRSQPPIELDRCQSIVLIRSWAWYVRCFPHLTYPRKQASPTTTSLWLKRTHGWRCTLCIRKKDTGLFMRSLREDTTVSPGTMHPLIGAVNLVWCTAPIKSARLVARTLPLDPHHLIDSTYCD